MHPRQSWLALGLLTALSVQAAVIYRWVDADGVVHYSDQASPGAEKIETATSSAGSAAGPRASTGQAPQMPRQAAQRRPQLQRIYDQLAAAGSSILRRRRRCGAPDALAVASPQSSDFLAFERQAAGFSAGRCFLCTAAAGSRHLWLTATITDQQTGESQNSNSVTFFVRQPTTLAPQSPLRK